MKSGPNKCVVEECVRLTENVFSLWLSADQETLTGTQPGRFLHILCGEGNLLRRPISICETDGGFIRILLEVEERAHGGFPSATAVTALISSVRSATGLT